MKTENLIQALSADLATRPTPVPRAIAQALIVSVPIALGLLFYVWQVRPDFWIVLSSTRFLFKFVFTVSVLGAGLWLVLRLTRPGTQAGPAMTALFVAGGLMLTAVVTELAVMPSSAWMSLLVGDMAGPCLLLIPVFSAAPLVALLYALKAGAPDDPKLAGAAAGLLAGGIGATIYASHCHNDSPLFVATWYIIALAAVTVIGRTLGGRMLRW